MDVLCNVMGVQRAYYCVSNHIIVLCDILLDNNNNNNNNNSNNTCFLQAIK